MVAVAVVVAVVGVFVFVVAAVVIVVVELVIILTEQFLLESQTLAKKNKFLQCSSVKCVYF